MQMESDQRKKNFKSNLTQKTMTSASSRKQNSANKITSMLKVSLLSEKTERQAVMNRKTSKIPEVE